MTPSSGRRTSVRAAPREYDEASADSRFEGCLSRALTGPFRRVESSLTMELAEYQKLSRRTAEYPREAWLAYPALGLSGEAGEVAERAKKTIRDDGGQATDERRAAMPKELGDVLWYVAQLASELQLDLDEIAQANLDKLLSRQQRGVLSGSGDER